MFNSNELAGHSGSTKKRRDPRPAIGWNGELLLYCQLVGAYRRGERFLGNRILAQPSWHRDRAYDFEVDWIPGLSGQRELTQIEAKTTTRGHGEPFFLDSQLEHILSCGWTLLTARISLFGRGRGSVSFTRIGPEHLSSWLEEDGPLGERLLEDEGENENEGKVKVDPAWMKWFGTSDLRLDTCFSCGVKCEVPAPENPRDCWEIPKCSECRGR